MVKRLSLWVCLLALAYAGVMLARSPNWTVDDAYITFRYADNLARHGQLTWNVDEDPVEGYTGVALPVLLAGLIRIGVSPILGSKVIGVVSFFVGGLLLGRVLSKLGVGSIVRAVIIALYFTAPIMTAHALSGLETLLFSASVIASVLALLTYLEEPGRTERRASILFALLLFTSFVRPEGVVLAGAFFLAVVFHRKWHRMETCRSLAVRFALFYVLPGMAYFVWRWSYYGLLLPNAFYAKSSGGWNQFHQQRQLVDFLNTYVLSLILACAVLVLPSLPRLWRDRREKRIVSHGYPFAIAGSAALVFMVVSACQYLRTDPVMNYAYRYYTPFFPLVLIGVGCLLHWGLQASALAWKGRPVRRVVVCAVLVGLCANQVVRYQAGLRTQLVIMKGYRELLRDVHIPTGKFLRACVPPSEWLIVHLDSGAIPYYAGLKTIDFGRLNDETLATNELTTEQQADYFYAHNAGAIVIASRDQHILRPFVGGLGLVRDPRFGGYSFLRDFGERGYRQCIYLRKDLCEQYVDSAVEVVPRPVQIR